MSNEVLKFWQSLDSDDPFEPFFAVAPILMHSIDANGVLVRVSSFWAAKLGYEPEEMVGRRSVEFLTEPSRRYAAEVKIPELFKVGSVSNVPFDFVRKDGKIVSVLMSVILEYDEAGEFVRSLAVMFDNTEAKRAAAQLQQKQRLDAVGQLVGGVAHDFNNLLAIIQGNLEFLEMNPDHPNRQEFIENALDAAKRGASLTQQLLSYGRKAHLSPTLVDLNAVVAKSDRLVRRLFPSNITIETVTGGGLWNISVDSAILETAVLNILNNARDALPDGGRLTIETCNVRIGEDYVDSRNEEIVPGRYVMLAISDTGTGMDSETLAKVFEPFFTTKEVGNGSGLGLSMVFGFMRQSNGAIRAYSELGVGSTFKLYFPAVSREGHADEPETVISGDGGTGKLVLVVEDEDKVRQVLAEQLRLDGLRVTECATGDAAFQQLEGGLRPDLLLTDIVMPGSLQGPELAKRARELFPDLRVLFISGYPSEAAIHGNGVRPEDKHLTKPVGQSDLVKAVMDLLSER